MNSLVFEGYITNILAQEIRPGDLLIMDNLPENKIKAFQNSMKRLGINYD